MDNKKYLYLGCFVATLLTTIVGLIIVSERILAETWFATSQFQDSHSFVHSISLLYTGCTSFVVLICRRYATFPKKLAFRYLKSPLLYMVPFLIVIFLFEGVFFWTVPMSDFEKNSVSVFVVAAMFLYIAARNLVNGQNLDSTGRHGLYFKDSPSFNAGLTLTMYLILISLFVMSQQVWWSWFIFMAASVAYFALFVVVLILGYFKMKFLQIVKPQWA